MTTIIASGQVAAPQGPKEAHEVASLASGLKRATSVFLKVSVGTAAVAVLSAAAIFVTEPLGSLAEIRAHLMPADIIQTAPEGIRWIEAQHASPLIEAGRQADGGLDVRKMMEAWRDAGMSHSDAAAAINLVNRTRPVLMGRADLMASVEHSVDQAKAHAELRDRFPFVAANLEKGIKIEGMEDWEIDTWNDRINNIETRLSHDLEAGMPTGSERSLDYQFAMMQDWNASRSDDMQVLMPSFIEVSKNEAGDYSASRLVDVLQRAGVSAHEAEVVYDYAMMLTKPLSDMPLSIAKQHLERAGAEIENVEEMFEINLENMARAAADANFSVRSDLGDETERQMWNDLRGMASIKDARVVSPSPVSMEDAKAALEKAVSQTGLRSLTPSLWQMRSASSMMELSEQLLTANNELSHATNWRGKVLGLDGRLELVMGPVMESAPTANAVVSADNSGRIQMVTTWNHAGHEWFHVWDHVAARYMLNRPNSRPITENAMLIRSFKDEGIKSAVVALNESLTTGSPDWDQKRTEFDKQNDSYYYRKGTEVGAFAFSGFLENTGAKLLADPTLNATLSLEPHRSPSASEQEHQKQFFEQVFRATANLGLSGEDGMFKPKMMHVAAWQSQRAEQSAIPGTHDHDHQQVDAPFSSSRRNAIYR